MKIAIIFLSDILHEQTLKFAEEIASETIYDVFLIVDNTELRQQQGKSIIYQVEDDLCIKHGFFGCNTKTGQTHIKKNVIAWDKMLYFMSLPSNDDYDFVWVFENDVFIPSLHAIRNIVSKYTTFDLVCANNIHKKYEAMDWHWQSISEHIGPPYYSSMVCAVGISRALLNCVKAQIPNGLFHIEAMFNTIAMQNNLKIKAAIELKSIVWTGDWNLDIMFQLRNNLFHPRKDIENHGQLREALINLNQNGYKPQIEIPDFLLK